MSRKIYTAEISIKKYLAEYVDIPKVDASCRHCPGYSKKWGCPEYDFDRLDLWNKYDRLRIYEWKCFPNDSMTKEECYEMLKQDQREMALFMMDEEKRNPGSFALPAGSCTFCGDEPCARVEGKPCRHPEVLRFSLEGLGANVSKTTEELIGLPLLWEGENGGYPEYYLTISGLLLKN